MKKAILYSVICALAVLFASCESDTTRYADQLKAQDKLIEEFISREKIKVLNSFPKEWGANDYVLTSSGLYFHLDNAGSGDTLRIGDKVNIRYRQRTLESDAIQEDYWTVQDTPHPTTLLYSIDNECAAWTEAIGYMKRSGAQCKIIVPSIIGFSTAQNSVTPYYFEMSIKFHY